MSIILDGTTGVTFPNGVTMSDGTSAPVTAAQGGTGLSSVGTAGNILTSNGTTWTSAAKTISSSTAQATTSGTSIDFTGIPSWVKRITVMYNNVSTTGSSPMMLRMGTAGGIISTGYTSTASNQGGTASNDTTGFLISQSSTTSAYILSGISTIALLSSTIWVYNSLLKSGTTGIQYAGGDLTFSGTTTTLRLTTSNGTDTFDNGSINILYE